MSMIFWLIAALSIETALSNPTNYTESNYLYHKKGELLKKVDELVKSNPNILTIEKLEQSDGTYDVAIPIVTLQTNRSRMYPGEKMKILMSFGEHGREIITTELALRLLECFYSEFNLGKCVPDEDQLLEVERILDYSILKLIPMENPNGRQKVEDGEYCERKNGRGVDINRNWDIEFGIKESDYDPTEEYPGEYPFSEPETRILRDLAKSFQPHVWVAVHSGMCAVFMPYDHIGEMPTGPSAEKQFEIIKALKTENLKQSCSFGSGGKTVGYVAHGTGTDYMYAVMNVPLAFTWEIYGDSDAKYEDCFRIFNPIDAEVFRTTLSMWIGTIFKFIQLLPEHPDMPYIPSATDSATESSSENRRMGQKAATLQNQGRTSNRVLAAGFLLFTGIGIVVLLNLIRKRRTKKYQRPFKY